MTTALLLAVASTLIGWTSASEVRRLPDRTQVERAVNAWHSCRTGPDCTGTAAFRRQLTRSRCNRLLADEFHPGRILCIFSGVDRRAGRPGSPFRNDCAYLMPTRRGWEVSSIPDADVCE